MKTSRTALARRRLRLRASVSNLAFRVDRKMTLKFGDLHLRQLRSIERAYARARGPEVLVIGDSSMYWFSPTEEDRRRLLTMIQDELGRRVRMVSVVGPGYHARISLAYLSALRFTRSRPRVAILPMSVLMATWPWVTHPEHGYQDVSAQLEQAVADPRSRPRRLAPTPPSVVEEYDAKPAPTLTDHVRTLGEMRMLIHARVESQSQKLTRLRHRMDYYNADRLDAQSPGIKLIEQLGELLAELDLPSVAYMTPVDHEALVATLGADAYDHVAHNVALVEKAFTAAVGDSGTLVADAFSSPSSHFMDPLHVNDVARRELARRIADAVRPFLAGDS